MFYIDNVGGKFNNERELLNAIPPNWVLAHTVEWTFCGVCVFIYIYIYRHAAWISLSIAYLGIVIAYFLYNFFFHL
jgi:hypothetical protein